MSSDSENFFAERDGFMSIGNKIAEPLCADDFVDISDCSDDVDFVEYDKAYENLHEKIIYEIIHQIRYNKFIRGDYTNDKFSFWQAIYNYDYFEENK